MPYIVTRQQAIDHLRIDEYSEEADDLDLKILAASAVVLEYIETTESDYIDSDSGDSDSGSSGGSEATYTYPYQIQAAVLLLLGDMYRHRSTDGTKTYTENGLPFVIKALLSTKNTFGIEST